MILYKRLHPIVIEIKGLTDDMVNWYQSVGGKTYMDDYWDYKGNRRKLNYVQYGKGKYCHHRKDGTVGVRLHFNEEDASVATMFILKFPEYIESHNIEQLHFE